MLEMQKVHLTLNFYSFPIKSPIEGFLLLYYFYFIMQTVQK